MGKRGRIKKYPDKDAVIQAIKERADRKMPMNPTSLIRGDKAFMDQALYNAARELYGTWWVALKKAGCAKLAVKYVSKYPDKQSVIEGILLRKKLKLSLSSSSLMMSRYKNFDRSLYVAATRDFETWPAAVEAAGIDYNREGSKVGVKAYPTAESITDAIHERVKKGYSLVGRDVMRSEPGRNNALYQAARKRYGHWGAALEAAGLETERFYKHRYFTKSTTQAKRAGRVPKYPDRTSVVEAIKKRVEDDLSLSSSSVMDKKSGMQDSALIAAAYREFGGWGAAVTEAGFDYSQINNRSRSKHFQNKENIIDAIHDRKEKGLSLVGRKVDRGESYNRDMPLYEAACKQFGNWLNALEAAGINPGDHYKVLKGRRKSKK